MDKPPQNQNPTFPPNPKRSWLDLLINGVPAGAVNRSTPPEVGVIDRGEAEPNLNLTIPESAPNILPSHLSPEYIRNIIIVM